MRWSKLVFVFVFVLLWCSIVFVLLRSGLRRSKFVLLLREESNQTSANLSTAHKPEICNDADFDDAKTVLKRPILAIVSMEWKQKGKIPPLELHPE